MMESFKTKNMSSSADLQQFLMWSYLFFSGRGVYPAESVSFHCILSTEYLNCQSVLWRLYDRVANFFLVLKDTGLRETVGLCLSQYHCFAQWNMKV